MQFLIDNSMYVTLIICLMILVGVLTFVSRVDGRVRRLERQLDLDQSSVG